MCNECGGGGVVRDGLNFISLLRYHGHGLIFVVAWQILWTSKSGVYHLLMLELPLASVSERVPLQLWASGNVCLYGRHKCRPLTQHGVSLFMCHHKCFNVLETAMLHSFNTHIDDKRPPPPFHNPCLETANGLLVETANGLLVEAPLVAL